MSYQTWLIPFIVLILTPISTFVTAQNFCFNNGNYTNNSIYSNNLKTILSSLSSNISTQGFLNISMGQNPDRVNVMALCRGDVQPNTCRSCIQNATVELVNSCPYQRQAILWSEFCTLRYSNESIYGIMADLPALMIHNSGNVSSPQQLFNEDLSTLLDQLREQAAAGGSLIKVAAANRTIPDFDTIYGLLQCSPDISQNDCNLCLSRAAQHLQECCTNSRGARIFQPSCTLRYETYTFYNLTRIQEAQAYAVQPQPASTPPPPRPAGSPGSAPNSPGSNSGGGSISVPSSTGDGISNANSTKLAIVALFFVLFVASYVSTFNMV